MKNTKLFIAQDGSWVTSDHILAILDEVRAAEAKVLYMHTGLTFGAPNPQLSRSELLDHLFQLISSLGIGTICVPTFTFSFCNGQKYNVQSSGSKMGALNEYIRRLPAAVRSVDPLLSTTLIGEDVDLVRDLGKNSIGENSTFDKLHRRGAGVKFLFFGTSVSECFTYTHYVEERLNTPYRYNRKFKGMVVDDGRQWEDEYTLFVRYRGVVPSTNGLLENYLLNHGLLRKRRSGDSSISCLSEPDGYEAIIRQLRKNVYCYIKSDPRDRNTEFFAENMVAL
jgi:aminoglycoside 3-N-acetyltransferase